MIRNGIIGAVSVAALLISSGAQAQSLEDLKKQLEILTKKVEELEKQQAKTPTVSKEEPAAVIRTPKGFEFNIRGRLLVDAGWGSDDNGTMDFEATKLRGAWLGVEGKAAKNVKYKFEADFGSNSVSVKDAFLEYSAKGGYKIRIGHFKQPVSAELLTSGTQTHFLERASHVAAFGIGRMTGIQVSTGGDNWTFLTGVFRGAPGASTSIDQGLTVAARATYGGKMDNGKWMVGGSLRHRDNGDTSARYRAKAHHNFSQRLVDTKTLSNDKDFMIEADAGVQWGSFHAAAEWAWLNARDAGSSGENASFKGGYFELGYWITGESTNLEINKGAWGRPKIKNEVLDGGMGGWQILGRYDYIDLQDAGINGGAQKTWIIGVNWYLNRWTRMVANYSHSDIEGNSAFTGYDGKNEADTFGLRFQVDW